MGTTHWRASGALLAVRDISLCERGRKVQLGKGRLRVKLNMGSVLGNLLRNKK